MKKVLLIVLNVLVLITLFACNSSDSPEETNAKSILNSTQALYKGEPVDVNIEDISLVKTQKAHNNDYSYFVFETDSYDWGYAELCNGEVITYYVGYSRSDAKTRCEDAADYRLTKMGGIGQ